MIVTPVAVATLPEEAENIALVLPAGIVTEDGSDTVEGVPVESETTTPPVGADAAAVIVPVDVFPLTTESGAKVSEDNVIVAAVTVIEVDPYFVESCVLVAFTVAAVVVAGAV
ncbi:MAG: hypothetical protein ABSF97_01745 [Candidatus Sulfotelmatobacter sp.]